MTWWPQNGSCAVAVQQAHSLRRHCFHGFRTAARILCRSATLTAGCLCLPHPQICRLMILSAGPGRVLWIRSPAFCCKLLVSFGPWKSCHPCSDTNTAAATLGATAIRWKVPSVLRTGWNGRKGSPDSPDSPDSPRICRTCQSRIWHPMRFEPCEVDPCLWVASAAGSIVVHVAPVQCSNSS